MGHGGSMSSDRGSTLLHGWSPAWIIVIILLLSLVLNTTSWSIDNKRPSPEPHRCLDLQDNQPNRQFYHLTDEFDETSNVTVGRVVLEPGHTVVHRLLNGLVTHIVVSLGYPLQTINVTKSSSPDQILSMLAGCTSTDNCPFSSHSAKSGDQDRDPNINLAAWLPLSYNYRSWMDTNQIMDLGPIVEMDQARYGLYTTSKQVHSTWQDLNVTLDHWRALQLSSVTSQYRSPVYPARPSCEPPPVGRRYCDDMRVDGCCRRDGICYSHLCKLDNNSCGILLSSTPDDDGGVLLRQINDLKLRLNILYLGADLYRVVRYMTQQNLPVLFYDLEPSPLTRRSEYARIALPHCSVADSDQSSQCDYEPNRVRKLIWSKVRRGAPELYYALERMTLKTSEFHSLLNAYESECSEKCCDMNALTCDWLKARPETWKPWIHNGKRDIYIGGLVPMQNGSTVDMTGIDIAARMALDRINNNDTILRDYTVRLPIKETTCSPYRSTWLFIDYIYNKTINLAGILGPGCSSSAMVVAGVARHYNRIVFSYSAEEPQLGDFPNFFRTVPGRDQDMEVLSALFDSVVGGPWMRIGMLTSVRYMKAFPEYLKKKGLEVLDLELPESAEVHFDPKYYLEQFRDKHINIIVGEFYEPFARAIMCQAYKMNMTSRHKYQWFLPRWLDDDWFNYTKPKKNSFRRLDNDVTGGGDIYLHEETLPCSEQEMAEAVSGYSVLSRPSYAPDDHMAIGDITVKQWKQEFLDRLHLEHGRKKMIEFLGHAYDAMWTYALSLDKLLRDNPGIEHFMSSNNVYEKMKQHIYECDFDGVTGHITIQKQTGLGGTETGGNREGVVEVRQWRPTRHGPKNFSFVTVGRYDPVNNAKFSEPVELLSVDGSFISDGSEHFQKECSVESFRRFLQISSCNTALGVAYAIGFGSVIIILTGIGVAFKIRYDGKVALTRRRMRELGLFDQDAIEELNLDDWEIRRDIVCMNRTLGEGAFGTVCGGEVYIESVKCWVACAVKTLKLGSSAMNRMDFLTEACLMKRFDHPNIVKLLGVTTTSTPALCIMEFMLYGDLKNYLLARRQLVRMNPNHEEVNAVSLTRMALDIIVGLQYLHSLKFVHRDLASRNCLVGESRVLKIGDFGMTRHISESDYYRYNKKGMLPVRWMAPESLTDGIFTPRTDIWSYGVLIYEILTFGSFPYQGLSNNQVLEYVRNGNKIDLPPGCSSQLKELINACWSFYPEDRPEPETIMNFITGIPNLITPFLDTPLAAVAMEGTDSLDLGIQATRRHMAVSRSLTGSNSASVAILQFQNCTNNATNNPEGVKLLTQSREVTDSVSCHSDDSSIVSGTVIGGFEQPRANGFHGSVESKKEDTEYVQIAANPERDGSDGSKLYNSDRICPLNNHVQMKYIQLVTHDKNGGDSDYGSDYSKDVTSQV